MVEVDFGDSPRSAKRAQIHCRPATTRIDRDRAPVTPVSKARLLLFAFGDFAFNLYWQSIMLFLLFYYTDALNLPIALAATIYMVASVWDGIANFTAGVLVDRRQNSFRYGTLIVAGAVPLGLSFALVYAPPFGSSAFGIASVLVAHLLFRTAYAAINVPYLAMSARISPDSDDRAFVAGMRMLFGTAASVVVALGTIPIGRWLTGNETAKAYLAAAIVFAIVGAAILIWVGATYREGAKIERPLPASLKAALTSLARNRAFVALNAAMMAMIVAVTVLGKSVLYYFKYLLNDPAAGQVALASMGVASSIAIALWMLAGRFVGLRALWLIASALAMIGLTTFAIIDVRTPFGMQVFLVVMQTIIVGLHFTFWAMLPNTIEYGELTTGLHVEGTVFGVAALLQRIAIGIATAILGWSYASAGYVANVAQSADTLAAMRATVALVPLVFLALSSVAMVFNPLGRGTHRRVIGELSSETPA
jgi:sugar (glycoside-pentoside-hexuronide) transporter